MLKIFQNYRSAIIDGPLQNILEMYVHDNVIDFKNILTIFEIFRKLNPLKIFCYMVQKINPL